MKPKRLSIWAPLPLDIYVRKPSATLPYPLEEKNHRLFSRARHGLWHGVRALGLGPSDTVLVPAYHHGSEVEALIRAGISCRFYELTDSLQPDEDRLYELLDPTVRALYLIHYFGIPQDGPRWRAWCDAHNLLMIEDAAMAFLSSWQERPVGSFGHLAIFCIYKTFGLPDGGAMVSSTLAPPPSSDGRLGVAQTVFRHGSWIAQRSGILASFHSRLGRTGDIPGTDFDLGDPTVRPSAATVRLLRRVIDPDAAHRRRRNYRYLLDHLADHVRPLFDSLPDGSSPTAFLVLVDPSSQRQLRVHLARSGIRVATFWQVAHPSVPSEGFERSRYLRLSVMGLPIHQELPEGSIEWISRSVLAATRG